MKLKCYLHNASGAPSCLVYVFIYFVRNGGDDDLAMDTSSLYSKSNLIIFQFCNSKAQVMSLVVFREELSGGEIFQHALSFSGGH